MRRGVWCCDQVARLVRAEGVTRTERVRTTRPDPLAAQHPDLVGQDDAATGPNSLRVTDPTYVPALADWAYAWSIIDALSRMIVGWRVAGHLRTRTVLDAIEMVRWSLDAHLTGLRCHLDRSNLVSSPACATANG